MPQLENQMSFIGIAVITFLIFILVGATAYLVFGQ
jgi:hypothetical protein